MAFSSHFPLDVLQLFSCSYCIYLGCNFGIFPTLMFHWALVMVQASSVGRIWGIVGCASLFIQPKYLANDSHLEL